MSKQKTSSKTVSPQKHIIPEKYLDLFYILSLFLLIIIFLSSAIFGNGFDSSDTLSSLAFKTYLEDAKASGNFPLWIPYIFSGMPSYASLLTTGARIWDVVAQVVFGIASFFGALFGSDVARLAFWYGFYGMGMYLLTKSKINDRFISFLVSFAAVFSTWIILWVMIGHNTKPVVLAFVPFLFLFLEELQEKFSLLVSALLIIAIHLMFEAGHLQLIFYSLLAIGIYLIVEIINRVITKNNLAGILRSTGVLVLAIGIAFLMSSDRYFSTLEYTPYSTRGSAPIVKSENQHQTETGGHDYEYATMWSFSPQELITFVVPNYFGFGKLEYKGQLTGNSSVRMHTYWGQKPFEDAAPYAGILVLLLAFFGAIRNYKNVFVQFLIILSIVAIILSFGYTFPLLYDFFYYNVPYFNKFRAPSMILVLVHFALPILAAYGIKEIFGIRENLTPKDRKTLNILVGISGLILISGFVFSAIFQTTYQEAVAASKYGKQMIQAYSETTFAEISNFIFDEMIADWYRVGIIALIGSILIYAYSLRKISSSLFSIGLFVLIAIDLWQVSYRPMEVAEKKADKIMFQKTDVINFLLEDKSKFRIADFTSQIVNLPAYFRLESVNGYHSAKLRIYQDLLDVANQGSTSQVTNPFLWNLLNVKYVITPQQIGGMQPIFQSQQTGAFVYFNAGYTPRAYFVDSVEVMKNIDILNKIKDGAFDPRKVAFLEKELPNKLSKNPENSIVKIKNYQNEYIKIETENSSDNLLVLSEIYYPAGWKAYIDGKETEILKTNYALRSVFVPAGKHTIEMKFESPAFEKGKLISTSLNIVVVILLGLGFFIEIRRRKKSKLVN
ncbi:MAG: YfhO family protein [Bacteroidota bacterium]